MSQQKSLWDMFTEWWSGLFSNSSPKESEETPDKPSSPESIPVQEQQPTPAPEPKTVHRYDPRYRGLEPQ